MLYLHEGKGKGNDEKKNLFLFSYARCYVCVPPNVTRPLVIVKVLDTTTNFDQEVRNPYGRVHRLNRDQQSSVDCLRMR